MKAVAWIIIALIAGFVGYAIGTYHALNWCVDLGLRFIDVDSIDKGDIINLIWKYKNRMGEVQNFSI